jgi:NAD(P)-dependent dehydrogenase (short-subunit alcohol dehydrogenase family)
MSLRFDERVAIVTGAGGALGKAYCFLLAERGAFIVANDLGAATTGTGANTSAAQKVVDAINAKYPSVGGTPSAISNYDSVEHGDKIVKAAIDAYGKIDIVINNAGNLQDTT